MEFDVDFISCLETQLLELDTLQCIFQTDELEISDITTVSDVRNLCQEFRTVYSHRKVDDCSDILKNIVCLKCISLDLNLSMTDELQSEDLKDSRVELHINFVLPHGYPKELPKVFVQSDGLSREQQGLLNASLKEYVGNNSNGEQMIYQIVDWIKMNCEPFFLKSLKKQELKEFENASGVMNSRQDNIGVDKQYASLWLYMHHIYNKEKRKNIISWAKELELTGFSLPGKPGVVYVEGLKKGIDEYFARLRRLSWKRMSCVQKDIYETILQKFSDFQELNFDAHGSRDYHMDLGKFHTFLKEHDLGSMFTVLFGIKD